SGCSLTIASPQRCRTFITKSNWLNSRKLPTLVPSRPTTWRRSTISILKTSESKKSRRSLKGRWRCRRKPRLHNFFGSAQFASTRDTCVALIRLVFFLDGFGSAHFCFFAGGTFLATVRLLSFVTFLEDIRD